MATSALKRMGIVKAIRIVSEMEIEQLHAIEIVLDHHSAGKPGGIIAGLRLLKQNVDEKDDERGDDDA